MGKGAGDITDRLGNDMVLNGRKNESQVNLHALIAMPNSNHAINKPCN